jgi:hypothetical protein
MLVVKNTGLQQRVQYCLITACDCYQKHVLSLYNTLCKSLHSMLSVILGFVHFCRKWRRNDDVFYKDIIYKVWAYCLCIKKKVKGTQDREFF